MGFLWLRGISWQMQIEKYQREFKFLIWRWRFVPISLRIYWDKKNQLWDPGNACYGDLIFKHPMRICQSLNFLENEFHQTWTLHFIKLGQSEWLSKTCWRYSLPPFPPWRYWVLIAEGLGSLRQLKNFAIWWEKKFPKSFPVWNSPRYGWYP